MIRLPGGAKLESNKVILCQHHRSLGCDFHIRAASPPGWDIKTKPHQGLCCWRGKNNEGLLHRWLGCLVGHTAQLVSNKEKHSLVIHQHNPPPPSLFLLIPWFQFRNKFNVVAGAQTRPQFQYQCNCDYQQIQHIPQSVNVGWVVWVLLDWGGSGVWPICQLWYYHSLTTPPREISHGECLGKDIRVSRLKRF